MPVTQISLLGQVDRLPSRMMPLYGSGPVTGGGGTPQFNAVDVTLTSTQLRNLAASPVFLVPGQAGMVPIVESSFIVFNPVTTPYNNVVLNLFVGNGATSGPTALENYTGILGILTPAVQSIAFFNPSYMSDTNDSPSVASILASDLIGSGIYLGAEAATGSGDGTLRVYLEYNFVQG